MLRGLSSLKYRVCSMHHTYSSSVSPFHAYTTQEGQKPGSAPKILTHWWRIKCWWWNNSETSVWCRASVENTTHALCHLMTQLPTVTVGLQRLKGHPFISNTIPVTFDFKQVGKQHYAFFSSLNTSNATNPPTLSHVAPLMLSITWNTRLGNSSGGVILSREDVTARPLNLRKRFWNIALVPGSQFNVLYNRSRYCSGIL